MPQGDHTESTRVGQETEGAGGKHGFSMGWNVRGQ